MLSLPDHKKFVKFCVCEYMCLFVYICACACVFVCVKFCGRKRNQWTSQHFVLTFDYFHI